MWASHPTRERRASGHGGRGSDGVRNGDLYLIVGTRAERRLFEQLAAETSFDPGALRGQQ